jgi:hypothetical protein
LSLKPGLLPPVLDTPLEPEPDDVGFDIIDRTVSRTRWLLVPDVPAPAPLPLPPSNNNNFSMIQKKRSAKFIYEKIFGCRYRMMRKMKYFLNEYIKN